MYAGDQARKKQLIKHGYRLPSALDHRPLSADEFWERIHQTVFMSATPAARELKWAKRPPVEMVIRPTFVCDPVIEIRPSKGEQLGDLLKEVKIRSSKGESSLAITLTKRDAEDLASFLSEQGIRSSFLHSGMSMAERSKTLVDLQSNEIDCLVGVNCLREGLDLPQVSFVVVLNTDSEGFLRSASALLQIVGRAARNRNGSAIFYANRMTLSMKKYIETTAERRRKQLQFNEANDCKVQTTKESTTMSFFDLLKEQIEEEKRFLRLYRGEENSSAVHDRGVPGLASSLPPLALQGKSSRMETRTGKIETDHIPSSPGIYLWKDLAGNTLYIGKAAKLRSRVKSYLLPRARHGRRIETMLTKATSVDVMLTPSERDALILESNLIKRHQPPFNVLLKDDEHYPYICASVGDSIPRLSIVPRRHEGTEAYKQFRYFGPYISYREINEVLDDIESKYDLRAQSFLARQGSISKNDYNRLFDTVLAHVFENETDCQDTTLLSRMREKYEQASLLFDSEYNRCRDVVTVQQERQPSGTETTITVLQLRGGLVSGQFSYACTLLACDCAEDLSLAMQSVLTTRHYPSGQEPTGPVSWFPDEILLTHPPLDIKEIKRVVRQSRKAAEPTRKGSVSVLMPAKQGARQQVDATSIDLATQNANHKARFSSAISDSVWCKGDAAAELAELLTLDEPPTRIECYDISHTQGDHSVGSRVVFVDSKPAPHLYRKFNIKPVNGVDDYASLEQILERRFHHAWSSEDGLVESADPWALPDLIVVDGGKGQLNAAVKGMSKAKVFPLLNPHISSRDTRGENFGVSVAVCALAKDKDEIFAYGNADPLNDTLTRRSSIASLARRKPPLCLERTSETSVSSEGLEIVRR